MSSHELLRFSVCTSPLGCPSVSHSHYKCNWFENYERRYPRVHCASRDQQPLGYWFCLGHSRHWVSCCIRQCWLRWSCSSDNLLQEEDRVVWHTELRWTTPLAGHWKPLVSVPLMTALWLIAMAPEVVQVLCLGTPWKCSFIPIPYAQDP